MNESRGARYRSPEHTRESGGPRGSEVADSFSAMNRLLSKRTFFKRRLLYFNLPSIRRIQIIICS